MAKSTTPVDRNLLEVSIKEAEKNGPLANLNELWKTSTVFYNEQITKMGDIANSPYPLITPSIVLLRSKDWKLPTLTQPGKKGRQKGSKITIGKKVSRSEKMKSFSESFKKMRKHTPGRFAKVLNKVEGGSLKSALKLKCLDCSNYEPKEIKNCRVTSCALYPYRPYQTTEILEPKSTIIANLELMPED